MQRKVITQNGTITYTLTFKKVKNINLRISHDGKISVSAPKRIPYDVIDDFIKSKQKWIFDCLEKYSALPKPDYKILNGNKISFLGDTYTLNISMSDKPCVFIRDNIIFVLTDDIKDQSKIDKVFYRWYDNMCDEVFRKTVFDICESFSSYNIKPNTVCSRFMKTRFGSCIPSKRKITLNKHLLKVSPKLIRYVAAHELAHLIVPNHSSEFYRVLSVLEPDYKALRQELKEFNFL